MGHPYSQELAAWTVALSAEHGVPYYANPLTGQTAWEAPTRELEAQGLALLAPVAAAQVNAISLYT